MSATRVLVTVTSIHDREAPYLQRLQDEGLEVVRRIGARGKLSEDELIVLARHAPDRPEGARQ